MSFEVHISRLREALSVIAKINNRTLLGNRRIRILSDAAPFMNGLQYGWIGYLHQLFLLFWVEYPIELARKKEIFSSNENLKSC